MDGEPPRWHRDKGVSRAGVFFTVGGRACLGHLRTDGRGADGPNTHSRDDKRMMCRARSATFQTCAGKTVVALMARRLFDGYFRDVGLQGVQLVDQEIHILCGDTY
jgi:hypothetical protein